MIIAFVGHSGSGKSTLMSHLVDNHGFIYPEWFTTRKKRNDSNDDIYQFLTNQQALMLQSTGKIQCCGIFHGHIYGTSYEDPIENNYVTAVDVKGMFELWDKYGDNVVGIFVDSDEDNRRERMLDRGDSNQLATSRINSDRETFKNAFHVTSYKITSSSREADLKELLSILDEIN